MTVRRTCQSILAFASVALSSCVGSNEVLFVTNTNIGIDADSKPPDLQIAYSRQEGYIGPSYDNGALAPVLARLQSNLNPFTPVVRQVYATGNAAVSLAQISPPDPQVRELVKRNKRVAYFTTASSVGLKVTFGELAPDSITLGYKRKEFSLIPVGTSDSGHCIDPDSLPKVAAKSGSVDCYGSVLANIALGGQIQDPKTTGLQLNELFATGLAAEYLAAKNPDVRNLFSQQLFMSDISSTYSCDADCVKIRAYVTTEATGRSDLQVKCLTPNNIKLPPDLYYFDQYKAARAACVRALEAR